MGLIRDAAPADLAVTAAIYRHAVLHGTGTYEIDPPDADEMAVRHSRIVGAGYPYLVAETERGVEGYAYLSAFRERAAYRFLVETSVYVAEAARGRGLGRILLEALIARAHDAGFRQMVAVIGDSENLGSIRLHARCGFTHAGTLAASGWKAGRWLDTVFMQRALGAGATCAPDR